jgi:hypothetical protein
VEVIGLSPDHARHINPKKGSDMRAHRTLMSLAIPLAYMVIWPDPALSQENRGTLEQRMACTPDVFRLCGAQIPDANRIVACLQQNTPQLSAPCRAVFDSSASELPQDLPRRRDTR